MSDLLTQIQSYDDGLAKEGQTYSGLLGLAIGGTKKVDIPSRAGFVYVRLRDNLSEVVQAINDKVSPIYDLPVLIQRRGNRWYILGKDTQRYENWGTSAPLLPAHARQHQFDRGAGTGGDTVFVFDDQFMPLLVYPSGTAGAGLLMVAPYLLQRPSDFILVGNTGTPNLLPYKPTNNQAILGLVVLNKTTGNPEILIASGTPFSASLTGTAQVSPYMPYPASHQEPLYAFRLVSGTTSLTWSNLYNARQFIGGNTSTGTSGSGVPTFHTGSVPFSGTDGVLKEDGSHFLWHETNRQLYIGKPKSDQFDFSDTYHLVLTANNQNEAIASAIYTYGTGTNGGPSPSYTTWRARGTFENRTPLKKGDSTLTLSSLGWDGTGWQNVARIRFLADNDFITGSVLGSRMDFDVVPSGSATRRTQFQIYGQSVNIPTGSSYNIGGVPLGLPSFEAHQTSAATGTSVAPSTNIVVVCNTETFDSHACYNPNTGRFTPNIPGTYLLYGYAFLANVADGKQVWTAISKNNSTYRWISLTNTSAAGAEAGGGGSQRFYLNGTTDFVTLVIWHDDSTNRNLYNVGSDIIHFGGYRISEFDICGL